MLLSPQVQVHIQVWPTFESFDSGSSLNLPTASFCIWFPEPTTAPAQKSAAGHVDQEQLQELQREARDDAHLYVTSFININSSTINDPIINPLWTINYPIINPLWDKGL